MRARSERFGLSSFWGISSAMQRWKSHVSTYTKPFLPVLVKLTVLRGKPIW